MSNHGPPAILAEAGAVAATTRFAETINSGTAIMEMKGTTGMIITEIVTTDTIEIIGTTRTTDITDHFLVTEVDITTGDPTIEIREITGITGTTGITGITEMIEIDTGIMIIVMKEIEVIREIEIMIVGVVKQGILIRVTLRTMNMLQRRFPTILSINHLMNNTYNELLFFP